MSFWTGTPESFDFQSTIAPEQKGLYQQLQGAAQGRGGGGAFGTAADYYRDLLSDKPADLEAFAAPEMRRFKEDIVPGLAEQFAGMGSGALSSSAFRNATTRAGTDLAERIAGIRAGLRQNAAQGLMGLGQQGMQQYGQVVHRPYQQGFLQSMMPVIGTALGAFGGPAMAALGGAAGQGLSNYFFPKQNVGAEQGAEVTK